MPSARPVTAAWLYGYHLEFSKLSKDCSGKCTIRASNTSSANVRGLVFEMSSREKPRLDLPEGLGHGYEQKEITLKTANGDLQAFTYVAAEDHIDPSLQPYDWYKAFVVAGAVEHGLPSDYVQKIRAVGSRGDPDEVRSLQNWDLLKRAGIDGVVDV